MWTVRPFRSLSEELPAEQTPLCVILVMEIGSCFTRLVELKEGGFKRHSK